jgi:hypothetical protein
MRIDALSYMSKVGYFRAMTIVRPVSQMSFTPAASPREWTPFR